jgi:hypothetical protein
MIINFPPTPPQEIVAEEGAMPKRIEVRPGNQLYKSTETADDSQLLSRTIYLGDRNN